MGFRRRACRQVERPQQDRVRHPQQEVEIRHVPPRTGAATSTGTFRRNPERSQDRVDFIRIVHLSDDSWLTTVTEFMAGTHRGFGTGEGWDGNDGALIFLALASVAFGEGKKGTAMPKTGAIGRV